MNITSWVQVSGHWECRILIESPLSFGMFNPLDNPVEDSIWSPSAVLPLLFFQDCRFYSCSSRPIENMLFKINHLQNAIFVSLYF